MNMLANTLRSPVVDNTGLDGVRLHVWMPDARSSLFASLDQQAMSLGLLAPRRFSITLAQAGKPAARGARGARFRSRRQAGGLSYGGWRRQGGLLVLAAPD